MGPTKQWIACHVEGVPTYLIRHRESWPDEVVADSYVEQDGDLVFVRDGREVMRIPSADVTSVAPKGES
jgi:hypothetical protein